MSTPAHAADSKPHFERVVDRRGDVPVAAGDLLATTMRYATRSVRFTATLRNAGSYKSANWQRGETFLLWYIDINRGGSNEYAAVVFNDGRDRLRGMIVDQWGYRKCGASARQRGDVFILKAHHRCIGSPRYVRFQALMRYDRSVADTSQRSVTADRAPNGMGWSRVVRIPPQPVKVTIERPERGALHLPYGTQGFIVGDVAFLYSETLSLWRRYHGSRRWERVAVGKDQSGGVAFQVEAKRSADYQVRYAGSRWYAPSRSRIVPVYARMVVTHDHAPWPTKYPRGSVLALNGRVRPPNPGGKVWLQRQTPNGWVSEASAVINDENAYALRTTLRTSGEFRFRVIASGTGPVRSGVSAAFDVAVYSARITKVEPSDALSEVSDLNSEYIAVVNNGRVPIDLFQWMVDANLVQSARIPYGNVHTRLDPGDGVRIHSGRGEAAPGHLYLGRSTPMWPPVGIARLFNDHGVLMSRYDY